MALKDTYFTISEAAQVLGVTRQTISRWVSEGKLRGERIGRETLIEKDEVYLETDTRTVLNMSTMIRNAIFSAVRQMCWREGEIRSFGVKDIQEAVKPLTFSIEVDNPFAFVIEKEDGTTEDVLADIGKIIVNEDAADHRIQVEIKTITRTESKDKPHWGMEAAKRPTKERSKMSKTRGVVH